MSKTEAKVKVKIKNFNLNYKGKKYKPGEEVEIEERFFREDCMEMILPEKAEGKKKPTKTEEVN